MARTYVGRRQNGDRLVQVSDANWSRTLVDRGGRGATRFGWGAQAAGSVSLARSILWDVLGADSEGLAVVFAGDVLAQLPDDAFILSEEDVRGWLADQKLRRMSPYELIQHLGSIALAEPEREVEVLRGLVDRCWNARSLAN